MCEHRNIYTRIDQRYVNTVFTKEYFLMKFLYGSDYNLSDINMSFSIRKINILIIYVLKRNKKLE